jgi:PAS domain S-box-containing protein
MRDVTKHQGLSESEELLNLAQEAGRLGIFEWLVQSGTVRMSRKFASIYGLTDLDGTYDNWLKCIFREDLPRYLDLLENAFEAKEREVEIEFRIVRPNDGELRWIESRRIIFYGKDAGAVRVVGVSADVTERERAAMQLRAFTETLEDVRQQPHLKVLFTTGYTPNAIVHQGRLDHDVDLISKPFTYESLGRKIRALLDA